MIQKCIHRDWGTYDSLTGFYSVSSLIKYRKNGNYRINTCTLLAIEENCLNTKSERALKKYRVRADDLQYHNIWFKNIT